MTALHAQTTRRLAIESREAGGVLCIVIRGGIIPHGVRSRFLHMMANHHRTSRERDHPRGGPVIWAKSGDSSRAVKGAKHLPADLPVFVKIDVEGHEETVIRELLSGAESERIMAIFYEHDDRWTDKSAVKALLGAAGFEQSRIYGRGKHYDVLATPI